MMISNVRPGVLPTLAAARHVATPTTVASTADSVTLSGAQPAPVPALPAGYPARGTAAERLAWFRSQADGVPGADKTGLVAKLALALSGEVNVPLPPPDSLLESCVRYSQPGHEILPALDEAARHPIASSFEELVDIAESMVSVMSFRQDRPMETAYAAMRLQLGLAECMGQVRPVREGEVSGEGFLLAPLRNLRPDAQSMAVAQCSLLAVKSGFDRLREVGRKFDREGGVANDDGAPKIEVAEEFVVIGGVKVAIRKG